MLINKKVFISKLWKFLEKFYPFDDVTQNGSLFMYRKINLQSKTLNDLYFLNILYISFPITLSSSLTTPFSIVILSNPLLGTDPSNIILYTVPSFSFFISKEYIVFKEFSSLYSLYVLLGKSILYFLLITSGNCLLLPSLSFCHLSFSYLISV